MGGEDPTTLTQGTGEDQPTPQPSITATPTTTTGSPTIVKPVHRGGLGGIVDEFLDAVAGTTRPGQVYSDSEGNQYIQHPHATRGQQWLKVAGEALEGAAAGAANGTGPGGKFRALQAGVEASDKIQKQAKDNEKNLSEEVRQANADRFNAIKLKHDLAMHDFQLGRLKVLANQEDIKFAQSQLDRERSLGSADLGVYKDEADLARVKEANPNFWKDVYANNIIRVPEINEKGERQGIHLFLRAPGVGSQLVPSGTPIKVFTPGAKPNDLPTLREEIPTVPMTHDQLDAYNNAAETRYQKAFADQAELKLKAAQTEDATQRGKEAAAQARHLNVESTMLQNQEGSEAARLSGKKGQEYLKMLPQDQRALVQSIGEGKLVPDRLNYMLGRNPQILADVTNAYPDFDSSKAQAYPQLYKDFTSGKSSQAMRNLNTAMQHIEDLRSLNTMTSRVPGTKDARAFASKLENVSAEVANALAKPGATATKDEIHNIKTSLSGMVNRDAAIRTQIGSMIEQYKTLRNVWMQGAPSAVYEAKMPDLSPEAKAIIIRHAPEDAAQWWHKPPQATMAVPNKSDGQLHWSDGKADLGVVQ